MRFTDGAGARRLMELSQNPTSGNEVGAILPITKPGDANSGWLMLFEFHEVGYISDTEKSSIDADALLTSIKKSTEEQNETRKKNGWTPFHVVAWSKTPFYDEQTHNLTWAIDGQEDGAPPDQKTVNYSVRILGRRGEMSVDLVMNSSQLPNALPAFNGLLSGFSFNSGNRYAEFVKGDKVAEFGLTALIAGGAGAAAVKTGLFAKLIKFLIAGFAAAWKVIAVAIAAIVSKFKALWNGLKGMFRPAVKPKQETGERQEQPVLPGGEDAGDHS